MDMARKGGTLGRALEKECKGERGVNGKGTPAIPCVYTSTLIIIVCVASSDPLSKALFGICIHNTAADWQRRSVPVRDQHTTTAATVLARRWLCEKAACSTIR